MPMVGSRSAGLIGEQFVRNTVMTIDCPQQASHPTHAGFGPVLNVGYLDAVPLAGPPSKVPLTARLGALVAGIAPALTVLAIPGGALALTVAQINPSLAARNAQTVQTIQPAVTAQTAQTAQTAVTDPRR
jgi:hypothetical protein